MTFTVEFTRDDHGEQPEELATRGDDREVQPPVQRKELVHQRARRWRQTKSATPATMRPATM